MKILVERSFVGTPFNRIAAYDVFHAFANLGVDSFHRKNQIMGGNSPSSSRRKHCCGGLAVATDISWNFSESEMTVQKIMNALHDCPSDSTVITG